MRLRLFLAYGIFALSGAAGLIYQSIWTQYLGLYLGHAAYAQSLVLAIFMGGMALGSWLASRPVATHWNLLRAYALIELAVAVFGALFHWEFVTLTSWAHATVIPGLSSPALVNLFKWSSGALLILPQTALLGMTFPLMSNGLMRWHREGDGAVLSTLYFTNSIGAAFGALFATFLLLPASGMPGTLRAAAAIGLLVSLVGAWLGRDGSTASKSGTSPGETAAKLDGGSFLLFAAFVTGASSFVYEIGWVRMLSLVFGATVHTFELMLAAFIAGLAFGGLWIRKRIDGYADARRVGGVVQMLMGLAALASLIAYDHAFDLVSWTRNALSPSDGGYVLYGVMTALGAFVLMVPSAFFAGMTLPLFTLALRRQGGGERSVGQIYAANTLGAICGVLLAVHVLLPALGLKLMMVIGAGADLLLGLALLRATTTNNPRPYLAALAFSAIGLVAALLGARFDPVRLGSGLFRGDEVIKLDSKAQFYRDGKTASVSVLDFSDNSRAIRTNGKADASLRLDPKLPPTADEITMVMAGALPWAYRADLRNVAVIGFGSGLSTHTLLRIPTIEAVDTIEIEPSMVEGARLFGGLVKLAYTDSRSHIHIEDAKTFLSATHSRYDAIISEPSNPWVSGVASLFTREFYEQAKTHLRPGGLFVQWIQQYEITDELVGAIINTLGDAFTDYHAYQSNMGDIIFVASTAPMGNPDYSRLFAEPAMRAELKRRWVASEEEFALHKVGDKAMLGAFFRAVSSRRTSDYYPFVSLEAPRARLKNSQASATLAVANLDLPIGEMLGGLNPPAATSEPILFDTFVDRQKETVAARSLLGAVLGKPDGISVVNRGVMGQFAMLLGGKDGCNAPLTPAMAMGALRETAKQTVPYLPGDMALMMWAEPKWATCAGDSAEVKAMFALIRALAARDGSAIWATAQVLLREHRGALDTQTLDYVYRAALLGGLVSGHEREIPAMSKAFEAQLELTPQPYRVMRQWLELMAKEKSP